MTWWTSSLSLPTPGGTYAEVAQPSSNSVKHCTPNF